MSQLARTDLYSLEKYALVRPEFRARVLDHKKNRTVHLAEHAGFYFEDRLTIQYQVQEMLRIERIFESSGIQDELDAYNPLIPDGTNLKATFMIEYPDVDQRRQALADLIGIEDRVWMQVEGHGKVTGIADEDLDRENETKTSSVHFLRFEFDQGMIADAKSGAGLAIGIDHPRFDHRLERLPESIRASLVADFH